MALTSSYVLDTCDLKAATVRGLLDRWSNRLNGHQTNNRANDRFRFQRCLAVFVPIQHTDGNPSAWNPIAITTRNLSGTGLGFLFQQKLDDGEIIVCIDDATRMLGTIVRQRGA